jgi:hypothetical protein
VSLCRLASDLTQSTFGERKYYFGLEFLHRFLQRVISCQRPDKIFIVDDPRSQLRSESALSQSMNKIWQPQLRVNHKSFSEVCVAGDVQFKWASVYEVPVHDDAHPTIVSWWHNADEQNARFNCHAAASPDTASAPKGGLAFARRWS